MTESGTQKDDTVVPQWSVLSGASGSTDDVSERWGMTPEEILRLAERGVFPCDIADWSHGDSRWVFSLDKELTPERIMDSVRDNKLYLRGVPSDVADGTLAWLDSYGETTPWGRFSRELLVCWCLSGAPLEADRSLLIWWCSYDAPTARDVANRWETLFGWYEMLTEAGYEHSCPHHGTGVCVAVSRWDLDNDPEPDFGVLPSDEPDQPETQLETAEML